MSLRDFSIIQKLGQGSFAKVYKALRINDQKIYAIKQIHINRLDQKSRQNALNQIRFLASFDCKNIIKYYEAFFDEQLSLLCIVMEYARQGDLSRTISQRKMKNQKFYEVQIWKALISLLHGVGYLHQRSILHRDIKPENIFICDGLYKIGDLNVSKILVDEYKKKQTQIGTPFYASPQIWQNCAYDHKCDVWSLGCLIYQMATLNPPFVAKSMDKLYSEVTTGKVKPIPQHYSNELSAIINRCLQKDPSKRPTIKQLQQNFTIKMYENLYYTTDELQAESAKAYQLLKTINFEKGKNIKQLQLPKPNYEDQNKPLSSDEVSKNHIKISQIPGKQIPQQAPDFVRFEQCDFKQSSLQNNKSVPDQHIRNNQISIINNILCQKASHQQGVCPKKKPQISESLKIDKLSYQIDYHYLDKLMSGNRNARKNQGHSGYQMKNQGRNNNFIGKIQLDEIKIRKAQKIIQTIQNKENKPATATHNKLNQQCNKSSSTNKRRSAPKTQFSAKKLQTIEQAELKKRQGKPSLMEAKNENISDFQNILASKLPKQMIRLAKRSIIEETVHAQKVLLKNRGIKDNQSYKMIVHNSKQKQIRNPKSRRQNIFSNARQFTNKKCSFGVLRSVQSSADL